jgi:hypothetical protein
MTIIEAYQSALESPPDSPFFMSIPFTGKRPRIRLTKADGETIFLVYNPLPAMMVAAAEICGRLDRCQARPREVFRAPVSQSAPPQHVPVLYRFANGKAPDENLGSCLFPATLFLRTRFFVRDKFTRAPIRYQRTRVLDPQNKTVRYVVREDLTFKLTYRFDAEINPINLNEYPPSFQSIETDSNENAINKALDGYLDAIEAQYETRQPATIVYPGFSPWTLDGAIRQVTWEVDGRGRAFTRVSRDTEELHVVRDFVERRLAERLRNLANADPAKAEAERRDIRATILDGTMTVTGISR